MGVVDFLFVGDVVVVVALVAAFLASFSSTWVSGAAAFSSREAVLTSNHKRMKVSNRLYIYIEVYIRE